MSQIDVKIKDMRIASLELEVKELRQAMNVHALVEERDRLIDSLRSTVRELRDNIVYVKSEGRTVNQVDLMQKEIDELKRERDLLRERIEEQKCGINGLSCKTVYDALARQCMTPFDEFKKERPW